MLFCFYVKWVLNPKNSSYFPIITRVPVDAQTLLKVHEMFISYLSYVLCDSIYAIKKVTRYAIFCFEKKQKAASLSTNAYHLVLAKSFIHS